MAFWKSNPSPAPKPKDTVTIMLYSNDDLVTRAEKICQALGYRGAIGNQVLGVYRLLKKYDELDQGRGGDDPDPGEEEQDDPPKLTVVK